MQLPSLLRPPVVLSVLLLFNAAAAVSAGREPWVIVSPLNASSLEDLAVKEVRRYLYLRTGTLVPVETAAPTADSKRNRILVGTQDRPWFGAAVFDPGEKQALPLLKAGDYRLKKMAAGDRAVLLLVGGDGAGTLYAAYRFAEHLGVRFYLHGDVIPDDRMPLAVPDVDETGRPLFALRGIQPFHDFPEGPDWWNRDDYLAILSQLPKLRMNFFGLHTYPERGPNAEPTVWIGLAGDADKQGRVSFAYPASYQNTRRGNWGYAPKRTGDYAFGAANLFERDDFGAEMMFGLTPEPQSPEGGVEVFNRAGELLRDAFTHARALGVKTCVGTETPLTVPQRVAERLQALGKNPADLATVRELYEGIFRRATAMYPLDYYWFWTPEGWTWESVKDEQVKRTIADLLAGVAAAKSAQAPFQLATCGWVLGPQQDRAMFDRVLPKELAVSCINRQVGMTPVDKGFAEVSGRGKWAIPWLEDDPALTSMQLWAGRMRRDAADARRYGCDGLMGIHWRTRVLGPAVSALAQAAWSQDTWNPNPQQPIALPRVEGPAGGQVADYPNNPIADTEEDPIYQSVRYNLTGYRLSLPNGSYTVVLKFCEPHYGESGKRVFDVKLQGRPVLEKLDIFARVGKNRALDYTYQNVAVSTGWLDIEFVSDIEFPSIAGIVIQGNGVSRKINCGGQAHGDYVADWPVAPAQESFPSTRDFYADWAAAEFGPASGAAAAAIFAKIDGQLPRPSDWVNGPGGIKPDSRPWDQVVKEYAFVDELAALEPLVVGAGNRARFDWWLNTFQCLRAMGRLNCLWGESNRALERVRKAASLEEQRRIVQDTALGQRRAIISALGEVYDHLLATVSNPGELGTVANWEQHLTPDVLTRPGQELEKVLGSPLPGDLQPPTAYRGPTRLIVPTVRTSVAPGESLALKVIILSEHPIRDAQIRWRAMGRGRYASAPLARVARGVYRARIPATTEDLEYYVRVIPSSGVPVHFPATAPRMNQTVVVQR